MIDIEDKIVSEDIFDQYFCCDLNKCKGICCVEGDSGAPLEIEEIEQIEEHFDKYRKYMTDEGAESVEQYGVFAIDEDGEYTTTLVDNKECAFSFKDGDFTLCAIEKAYRNGDIEFNKPISCHLYPIRIMNFSNGMTGINYHKWDICSDAIKNGCAKKVKVYQALKEPLIRAFGEQFYQHLTDVDEILEKEKNK